MPVSKRTIKATNLAIYWKGWTIITEQNGAVLTDELTKHSRMSSVGYDALSSRVE